MIKAYGNNILVQCNNVATSGVLHLPDTHKSINPACRLLSIGHKVEGRFWPIGGTIFVKSFINDRSQSSFELKEFPGAKFFFTDYRNALAALYGANIWPIGNRILIKRDRRVNAGGTIDTPDNIKTAYQSLEGEIVRFGLQPKMKGYHSGAKIGDTVVLNKWEMHMEEVEIRGQGYHLIVNESDIQYVKHEGDKKQA